MSHSDIDLPRPLSVDPDRSAESHPRDDAFETDLLILLGSGVFDERYYRTAAGLRPDEDAARHYLSIGCKAGIEPSDGFDGNFLAPYFEAAGFTGSPALTYAMFRAAGWAAYPTRTQAEAVAHIVRNSDLFEAENYRIRLNQKAQGLDPALHYVLVGERRSNTPSKRFDPNYYCDRYPDVANANVCFLAHYVQHGRAEGRRALPVAAEFAPDALRFAPEKETIILVSHDSSRTGAPMVALNVGQRLRNKYNIITVLLRGGGLVDDFNQISAHLICFGDNDRLSVEFKYLVNLILRECSVKYSIVNSIASWEIIPSLAAAFVPTVVLIHEFASYHRPIRFMRETLGWITEPVFSTEMTANSFRKDHPSLLQRRVHIVAQGQCQIPAVPTDLNLRAERRRLETAMRPPGGEQDFVVLGAGSVHLRKGIDVFLATAAAAQRYAGKRKIRFVWIGFGYDPDKDMNYSVYLQEQIARSHLSDQVTLLDEVAEFERVYGMADAFYLASRLDPLPNVAIDAAIHGLPIVCFEGASGFAEILQRDKTASLAVLPYLDADAAARLIVKMANDDRFCTRIAKAIHNLAHASFDMERYVERLDAIGGDAMASMRQRRADFDTLLDDPSFDTDIALPAKGPIRTRDAAISQVLAYWSASRIAPHSIDHLDFRRPSAGFNPQIYAHHHSELANTEINPFADFIRKGKPQGEWLHPVIRPDLLVPELNLGLRDDLRVAIHGHFHYPELIHDFLAKLAVNNARCDLLLSTDKDRKAEMLRAAAADFGHPHVEIRIAPNRGRDIAPFLTDFGHQILNRYDIIGHVHAKRSLAVDSNLGETWREFLWQHLLGNFYPMMDIVLMHFAQDEKLGLVFPEDPHLVDWNDNLEIAQQLAIRAGIDQKLPPFFEFPIGTMFWARSRALKPLFDLNLAWNDYPEEPIDNDGTILHALERLIPFAANSQGFTWATTHIPGVTW